MESKKKSLSGKAKFSLFAALGLSLVIAAAVFAATIIIDAFTAETQQLEVCCGSTTAASYSGLDASIIGLERDAVLQLISGTSASYLDINAGGSGVVAFSAGSGTHLKTTITWDGIDHDPYTLNPTGLGGVNLLQATDDGIVIEITDWEGNDLDIRLYIYTDGSNYSYAVLPLRGHAIFPPPENFSLSFDDDFTDVGEGADLSNVGAIVLEIQTVATGADVSIDLLILDTTRDFGDLPAVYGNTLKEDDGARHSRTDTFLGDLMDTEVNGVEAAGADGDDLNQQDDEDGVVPVGEWMEGADGGAVHIETTSGSDTDAACVDGWIDWNNDGDFDDNLEHIIDSVVIYDLGFINNETLNFDVPGGALSGVGTKSFYARFRAAPEPVLDSVCDVDMAPTGYVHGGEVEDYLWDFTNEGCEEEDGCVEFSLLSIEYVGDEVVFSWKITDNCEYGLSNIAFSLPEDVSAVDYPPAGGIYTSAVSGHSYSVENPGTAWFDGPLPFGGESPGGKPGRPFRAIKFEEMGSDGIKNGDYEIFIYTLKAEDYDPELPIVIVLKGGTYSYQAVIIPSVCAEE